MTIISQLCSALVDLTRSIGYHAEPFPWAKTFMASSNLSILNCVIADLHMPVIGGLNLIRRLQEQGTTAPAILITALPEPHLEDEVISVNAQCFLTKPLEANVLLDCVERKFLR